VLKLHTARNAFALNATTPHPHWGVAEGNIRCQCVDLTKFWMLAAEMLGLKTGEVVYLYPKLSKGTKESSNPEDRDLRSAKVSVPAHSESQLWHGQEELMLVDNHFGWNAYEACFKFTHPDSAGKEKTRYYAGGAGVYDTAQEVMKDVCRETHWIFRVKKSSRPVRICENPGPSPAEKWKL
jgi:hypothetical protein